jgi:chromosome segregation ATPase
LFSTKSLNLKDLTSSVESLAKRTNGLIDAYEQGQQRILSLVAEKEKMQGRLEELNAEIERLKEENKVLKVASAIKGDEEKVTESKRKISQLVREIDKCIALLTD